MKILSKKGYTVRSVCSLIGISPQAYYKRLKKRDIEGSLYNQMEELVKENRNIKSRAGLRAIHYKEKLSTLLGVNKFEKQMSLRGYALKPYRSFIKTTDSRGLHHKYGNQIDGIDVTHENQVIVGDITYYRQQADLFYIFLFTDLYTLEIKGACGSKNMQGIHAEKCLRQVMKYNDRKRYNQKLIIHTDGGSQYRSDAYQSMLRQAGIIPSQSKNCLENGLAERINGIIKNEYLNDYNIKSEKQLNKALSNIIGQHNKVWPSARLGWRTPWEYALWTKELPAKQKPVLQVKEINNFEKRVLKACQSKMFIPLN